MNISDITNKELIEELHKRFDQYIFMGIPVGQKSQKIDGVEAVNQFQTAFKAPTISEAIGMSEFFKHSLISSQFSRAEFEQQKVAKPNNNRLDVNE